VVDIGGDKLGATIAASAIAAARADQFHGMSKRTPAALPRDVLTGRMESAATTDCFSADLDAHRAAATIYLSKTLPLRTLSSFDLSVIICRTPCFVAPWLNLCASTAFRTIHKPCLCSPLSIGAGPILIAGCGGKLSASFSKKACRSGYNIAIFFLNRFLLRTDLRGKPQLSRLRNIAQFLRLLVRPQQRAFSSLNHKR
jgi:hypothetical protein